MTLWKWVFIETYSGAEMSKEESLLVPDATRGWRLESPAAGLTETITVLKHRVLPVALCQEVSQGWEEVTLLASRAAASRQVTVETF